MFVDVNIDFNTIKIRIQNGILNIFVFFIMLIFDSIILVDNYIVCKFYMYILNYLTKLECF